jgi:hypothetical protein
MIVNIKQGYFDSLRWCSLERAILFNQKYYISIKTLNNWHWLSIILTVLEHILLATENRGLSFLNSLAFIHSQYVCEDTMCHGFFTMCGFRPLRGTNRISFEIWIVDHRIRQQECHHTNYASLLPRDFRLHLPSFPYL